MEKSSQKGENESTFTNICNLHVFLILCFAGTSHADKTLYIGGLFPVTGSSVESSGQSLLAASELAINMVNNRLDLLPGYRLQMIWKDTQCDPGHAINALFEFLYTRPPVMMLLGAACSSATRATAQAGAFWDLLQVSYASTSSDLSDKKQFPSLYSIVPPDSSINDARIAFLKHFQWRRVATIRQNNYVFDEVMDSFQDNLIKNNIEVIASELFTDDPKIHLESLKKQDARIIVGMFYEDKARRVFCEAYKQGMFGENYMWLLLDWYDEKQWWRSADEHVDCNEEQMKEAIEGYLSIESVRIVSSNQSTISGITSAEFLNMYSKLRKNHTDLYVPFAFDSVWIIALTLNNSMHEISSKLNKSLEDFTYKDNKFTNVMQKTLEQLEFQGITGRIQFTDTGHRTRPAFVKQMQSGRSVTVGTYFPRQDRIVFESPGVIWQGGSGPPSDSKLTIYEVQYVSTALFCVIVILTSGGILLALYFLWFNFVEREHSYIKLSSPSLNNLIILGCVLIYIAVFFVAIDGKTVDVNVLPRLCMAEGFLLSIGYSLAVGAMFSKTWRVYQIFINVKPKKKIFKDAELASVIVLLVFIDVLMMSLWAGVDPPQVTTVALQSQVKDEPSQRLIPQQQYCSSEYQTTWLYILLGYKVLLLVIGCYIAWVTRKVKVRSLNDSRFVGMSVYNIVLFAIVGIPLSFLVDGHVNVFVACLSLLILLPTTASLCLLFIPKIVKLKNNTEELLRLQSLSAIRITTDSSTSAHGTNSDPNAISHLQAEISVLQGEIRQLKLAKKDTKPKPNLSVTICEPTGNSNRKSIGNMVASPRPRIGKRSITCQNAEELKVGRRRRRRSCSFSGPYLQRRSIDLGSLSSTFADPLLVLKAENKELKRRVQEARISETGKLAKVLYENAELNKKIVELSMKNAPTEDAEKVSRLLKENAELKRQLGEVSILNSVWCETTPRLQRKQVDDRKMTRELKELQQLLKVDLGSRRHDSFGSASLSRPPPIGRSLSSVELQRPKDSGTLKSSSISPLAQDVPKKFTFNDKRESSPHESHKSGIILTVTEADKSESPRFSPSIVRRDFIDGCESEDVHTDSYEISGEKINKGFQEDEKPSKSWTQGKITKDSPKKDFAIEGTTTRVVTSVPGSASGPKEQRLTLDSCMEDPSINDPVTDANMMKTSPEKQLQLRRQQQPASENAPPQKATESIPDAIHAPLTSFDMLLDKNFNFQSTKTLRRDSEVQERKDLGLQTENDDSLSQNTANYFVENERTESAQELSKHDGLSIDQSATPSDLGSLVDSSPHGNKLKRKRGKKKDGKIERTYFV